MLTYWTVILLIMGFAAYRDHKTGELPLWLFAVMAAVITTQCWVIDKNFDWVSSLIGLGVGGVSFFIMALFFNGGGGDVIMMAALGWCIGYRNIIFTILVATAVYAIMFFAKANQKKKKVSKIQLPYAPAAFAGTCIVALVNILNNINTFR